MSSKIIDLGLIILFLMLSVKYSSLVPCVSRASNSENQSTTNNTTAECNNTVATTNQEEVRDIEGCQCRWKDDSESCMSLEEAIYDMYERIDSENDTPYQFFSLKDLLYSSILAGRDGLDGDLQPPPIDSDFNNEGEMRLARGRCTNLAGSYNFTTSDTESCRWSFNCMQRQSQFPSFYVEAELDSGAERCTPVTTENKRFVRTVCQANSTLPHWLECDCEKLVVGYKHY